MTKTNGLIVVEDIADVTLISFRQKRLLADGDVDAVRERLYPLVDDLGRRKLVFDLIGIEFWTDSLLGILVRAYQKLRATGGRFVLCNVPPNVRPLFSITKLDKLFSLSEAGRDACVQEMLLLRLPRQEPDAHERSEPRGVPAE